MTMKETLRYKAFEGSIECDLASGVLHGQILFISDLVTYEADSITELRAAFIEAVDDYLADCQNEG